MQYRPTDCAKPPDRSGNTAWSVPKGLLTLYKVGWSAVHCHLIGCTRLPDQSHKASRVIVQSSLISTTCKATQMIISRLLKWWNKIDAWWWLRRKSWPSVYIKKHKTCPLRLHCDRARGRSPRLNHDAGNYLVVLHFTLDGDPCRFCEKFPISRFLRHKLLSFHQSRAPGGKFCQSVRVAWEVGDGFPEG